MTELAIRQVSLAVKIKQITGLAGTLSVDRNTNAFLQNLEIVTDDGRNTGGLSAGQVKYIESIWQDHFA